MPAVFSVLARCAHNRCNTRRPLPYSSSFKHPLAKLSRTGGSEIALQKLPITYNMQFLPAPSRSRPAIVLIRRGPRGNSPVTTGPRNRAGSRRRNWTRIFSRGRERVSQEAERFRREMCVYERARVRSLRLFRMLELIVTVYVRAIYCSKESFEQFTRYEKYSNGASSSRLTRKSAVHC